MPVIHIEARLVRITARNPNPGQWLLIHHDDSYEILDHADALALQRRTGGSPSKTRLKAVTAPVPPAPSVRLQHTIAVNGKSVHVQPKLLEAMRLVAKTGPITVTKAAKTLSSAGGALSAAKKLGFMEAVRESAKSPAYLYDLTNNGRAILLAAQGKGPLSQSGA